MPLSRSSSHSGTLEQYLDDNQPQQPQWAHQHVSTNASVHSHQSSPAAWGGGGPSSAHRPAPPPPSSSSRSGNYSRMTSRSQDQMLEVLDALDQEDQASAQRNALDRYLSGNNNNNNNNNHRTTTTTRAYQSITSNSVCSASSQPSGRYSIGSHASRATTGGNSVFSMRSTESAPVWGGMPLRLPSRKSSRRRNNRNNNGPLESSFASERGGEFWSERARWLTNTKRKRATANLAILFLVFLSLNFGYDRAVSVFDLQSSDDIGQREEVYRIRHRKGNGDLVSMRPSVGYFNLSCPFEWSKYSCAYMQRGADDAEIVRASTDHYLRNLNKIQAAFHHAESIIKPKRVFFTGDSLMRQLFIGLTCNAASLGTNLIEYAATPWKDEWPCKANVCPLVMRGGDHGGFDAASVRLVNGIELHFVPHMGFIDDETAEEDVLQRLVRDIASGGRVTFGEKTAMEPGGDDVDVLVYNVGLHFGEHKAKKSINLFGNGISRTLMEQDRNSTHPRHGRPRPRTIYVTTPAQHYNTPDGQWQPGGMTKEKLQCVDRVSSNPRAEVEKRLLVPGDNVDVLLDYDDLELGGMHVRHGQDCSHYCMPGVPDVVAARLMEEILV